MSNVINTNVKSLMARDSMTINQRALTTTMQRLSTGKRINSAADDAAGLGIATRMDSQIRGLNMAIKNANDTISVVQTAEGAMQEVDGILQRMRELAVQAASDTNGSEDRDYLQKEISQLSQEIDRIAGTTQFNSMNVLDGTFKGKVFQIGSNQGQTMGVSIGSMKASMLGVASGTSNVGTPVVAAGGVEGLKAAGQKATQTVVGMTFSTNDTYAFDVIDGATGRTAVFEFVDTAAAAETLDLSSPVSKQKFLDQLNKTLAESAGNTSIEASKGSFTDNTDLTDPTNVNAVKFSISIDGGMPLKSVDLRDRLSIDLAGALDDVDLSEVALALESELQSLYDDSIQVSQTAGVFTVTDNKGRQIILAQGGGDGTLFGTDAANDGPLLVNANPKNNIVAQWSGNELLLTNKSGGKITVDNYDAGAGVSASAVIFDTKSVSASQNYDPIALIGTDTSDKLASFSGKTESSALAVSFANRHGGDGTASASFKLVTATGQEIADLTGASALEIGDDDTAVTNQTIIDDVKAAIASGVASLNDAGIKVTDFDVKFNGNTLSITNSQGLSMKVSEYSSTDTQAVVTPLNELGAAKTVSSQGYGWSETRIKINPNAMSVDLATGVTGNVVIQVDGEDVATAPASIAFNDVFDSWDGIGVTGEGLAADLEDFLALHLDFPGGAVTDAEYSLANAKVEWDASTNELVIRDAGGHSITFDASALADAGEIFVDPTVTGTSNNNITTGTTSNVSAGQVYEATQVTMKLSDTKDGALNFKLNGVALDAASIDWDAAEPAKVSDLKDALDTMVNTLNTDHPGAQYEYSLNGTEITFMNRAGSRIEISDFESEGAGLQATLTPKAGQGNAVTIGYNEALDTAEAVGVSSVATNAALKLTGDDLVSISVSDGTKSYTLRSAAVDVNDLASTQSFVAKFNEVLGASSIRASMDTKGNLYLNDSTGGDVILTGFSSARGFDASWKPQAGQGQATTVNSGYVGSDAPSSVQSESSGAVGSGGSVAQISIATQAGASNALKVIDKALSYVNHERSMLGAIENRLSHTIDNLTNVVTNTSASKSRIMDTDYAAETTEWARAQIIQQAATAMLAQANQQPQSVLALLK